MNKQIALLLTIGALALVWVANSFAEDHRAGDLSVAPYSFKPREGEPVDAEYGTLYVPATRSKANSGLFELAFVRFKSTAKTPGPPIVYVAGGPGLSGIDAARGTRFPLFMAMREFGDVIAFDKRGTGASKPRYTVQLPYDFPLDEPIDPTSLRKIAPIIRREVRKLEEQGLDLHSLSPVEIADDLNDLRVALRSETMTLWGISAGTYLSAITIRRYGDSIDKAILAGMGGPDHMLKLPSQQEELLKELGRRVAADAELGPLVPDLMGLVRQVLDQLEHEPVLTTLHDPRARSHIDVVVDKTTMQYHTAMLLGTTTTLRTIPALYYRASKGDFSQVARTAYFVRRGPPSVNVLDLIVRCAAGTSEARLKRVKREAPNTLLGDVINLPFSELFELFGELDLGDSFRGPIQSHVRTLFISGTLDGRTPPENAIEVKAGFPNSEHLVIDGAGHSDELFLSSPQIVETIQEFMRGESLSTTRIQLPPLEFSPLGED